MTTSFLKELQRAHASPGPDTPYARFAGPTGLLALRDSLLVQVESLTGRGMRLHVLVDPVPADPLKQAAGRARAATVLLNAKASAHVHAPYLLALGDIGRDETIDQALDLGFAEATRRADRKTRGSTICAWLACGPGEEPAVAQSLSEVSRRHATSRQERFLRLWDPRVFELLMPMLPNRARHELTGGAAGWWWVDRGGRLASRHATDGDSRLDASAGWGSAKVLDTLGATGAINGVLNALQDADVAFDRLPSLSALLALFDRARAHWRLEDDFDLIQFALYVVLVRADFDGDPDVRAAMAAAQARGQSCLDALSSFDESHWEQRRDV